NGIRHVPLDNRDFDTSGQIVPAHVYHQVGIVGLINPERLGIVARNIDVLLGHGAHGWVHNDSGRREASACRGQDVAAEVSGETLRHLAAAAIAYTDKEHALAFLPSHNLERKSS